MSAGMPDDRGLEARFTFAGSLIREAATLALSHFRD